MLLTSPLVTCGLLVFGTALEQVRALGDRFLTALGRSTAASAVSDITVEEVGKNAPEAAARDRFVSTSPKPASEEYRERLDSGGIPPYDLSKLRFS